MLIVKIFVDDIIFGATNENMCKNFAKCVQDKFEMSMMSELKRFGMMGAKSLATPMCTSIKLDKDENGKYVDEKLYRGMIDSLIYITTSRPNIMFSICICARFQPCPKESHLVAVKRKFRYLIDTHDLGIFYPRGIAFELNGFSNVDYAECKVDRKSTSGTCQVLRHS